MTKTMLIDDRMTKGIIAGATGAIMQNIYSYIAYLLDLTNVLYIDVAKGVLFNNNYTGMLSTFVALLGHIIIDTFWGVLYAFLIKETSSKYYILKGITFGAGIWFVIRVTGIKILKLPIFMGTNPATALMFLLGAVLYGVTIAVVLKKLNIKN